MIICRDCGRIWFKCSCPPENPYGINSTVNVKQSITPKTPKPMNKIFRIQILPGGCLIKAGHVVARSEREALLKFIENIPEDDPIWTAPQWQSIHVHEANQAFVL